MFKNIFSKNLFFFFLITSKCFYSQDYWSIERSPVIQNQTSTQINVKDNTKFILDVDVLNQYVNQSLSKSEYLLISLPNNIGGFDEYKVVETSIMPQKLSDKYPSIRTYKGYMSNDLTTTIRFSITNFGIHGMSISGNRPTLFIEPAEKVYNSKFILHQAYNKNDISSDKENSFECLSEANGTKKFDYSNEISSTESIFNTESNDSKLRVYRTAITTTSQ